MVVVIFSGGGEDKLKRRMWKTPSPHTKPMIMSIALVVNLGIRHAVKAFFSREKRFSI